MSTFRNKSRFRQQGMVTVWAVIFLITAVIFVLSQTLNITGSNSIDNSRQLESTQAFFLAESGLERARGIMASSATSGALTDSVCTGITTDGLCGTGSFSLDTGRSFCYHLAESRQNTCTGTGTGLCTTCTVRITGTAGSASRTLNLKINLTSDNGVTGFGTKVTMTLKNTLGVPATVLFHLAWRRNGGTDGQTITGNNASASRCLLSNCGLQWNVESSSGDRSVGSMGVSVNNIAAGSTYTVTQTIENARNYAQVGIWFPGLSTSAAPTLLGSYWDDASGGGTVNHSGNTPSAGQTNSGVATSSGTCTTPTNSTNTQQACTRWCYGADTLVFGVSARSRTVADEITGVRFNTAGSPLQNIALTRIAHFPNTDGTIANATGDIYSEIWKTYNPAYMSTSTGAGATSYPTAVKATAGANINLDAQIKEKSTTMAVASLADSNTKICSGDTITGSLDFQSGTTIKEPAGCTSVTPTTTPVTFTLSKEVIGSISKNTNGIIASSTTLLVQGQTGSNFIAGTTITLPSGSPVPSTIASGPVSGNYTLSTPVNVGTTTIITQGSSGTTITLPSGSPVPSTIGTIVTVYSGTGQLAAGTTVQSVGTGSFTVSSEPTTPITGAAICGGICAFFNDPSSTSSATEFQITRTADTNQWAGGFTCLSGVDNAKVVLVTGSSTSASTWNEVVQ